MRIPDVVTNWAKANPDTARAIVASVVGALILGTMGAVARCGMQRDADAAREAALAAPPRRDHPPAQAPMSEIEQAAGVYRDMPARYTIKETERIDAPRANRLSIRVTVPPGMSRQELELNLRHALMRAYETSNDRLGAVNVYAYLDDGGKVDLDDIATAGRGDFAPGGAWAAADASVPIRKWSAKIDLMERYFTPQPELVPVGAERVLHADNGERIAVSNKARSWTDKDIVARLPVGTKVRILAAETFETGAPKAEVRYEVTTIGGVRGWVHGFEVRAELPAN